MATEDYTRDRLFQFLRQSSIEGILNPPVAIPFVKINVIKVRIQK